jgi:hypothetical protein
VIPDITPTPSITPSSTSTWTPTPSQTPTYTPTPGSGSTGFRSPAAQQASSGGDHNGYESNANDAFGDDGLFASDSNSGTATSPDCAGPGKDRHQFYDYSFPIPAGSTITGIEVRLDARADSATGQPKLCIQLSWDGGSSWTEVQATTALGTAEASYFLGGSADSWGHAWNDGELSNATFRLRLTNVARDLSRDFFLDWVAVNVHYSGGATPTATATATPSPTATNTPTPTYTPSATATAGPGGDTGLVSPQADAAAGGGDRDGFESSPADAYGDDGLPAADLNSGNSPSTDCLNKGKDKHTFYSFPVTLPAEAVINGIEIRLDANADSTAGAPLMCVQLSWDGGNSWTAAQVTLVLGTDETTYLLGGPADGWGRSWSAADFAGSSFQVRLTNVSAATARDFYLDWVAVRVYYQ